MNRLVHLKETLKKNIYDNADYDNLEFVLLDYNSSDGLEAYIKSELSAFVTSGKLIYYRTEGHESYDRSHSRNLAFKLSTGAIVCNIDADNFTGIGFAMYVNLMFNQKKDFFLSTHHDGNLTKDVLGRICVMKEHFLMVGGYDERMKHYGFEDFDFANRLEMLGLKREFITSVSYLKAISHSDRQRMENGLNAIGLDKLLISYLSPAESELLFLFKSGQVYNGTIISNRNFNSLYPTVSTRPLKYKYSIKEPDWLCGTWTTRKNALLIENSGKKRVLNLVDGLFWSNDNQCYVLMKDLKVREELTFFLHQISSRNVMEANINTKTFRVNQGGFGIATFFMNFNPLKIASQ